MLNFELSGKWSTDCAVTPEVGGRPVAVVEFNSPTSGSPSVVQTFVTNRGIMKLRWQIVEAALVTKEKIKLTVGIADQTATEPNGQEEKLDLFDGKPSEFVWVKNGDKLETKFAQALAPVVLEKCLK